MAGQFFYLYMIMDVWSRKIIDYASHITECAEHASALIELACAKEDVMPDELILHSDNGGPMKGATMLATLQLLGVAPSFSRPRVSDDNPYSESLFRTAKTWHGSTKRRFASLADALEWAASFVQWYNHEHVHSAIRFVTPAERHAGRHEEILDRRRRTFEAARRRHPERFNGPLRSFDPVAVVALHSGDDSATEAA